jgi:hypothetical protein
MPPYGRRMKNRISKFALALVLCVGGASGAVLTPSPATAGDSHKDLNLYTMPRDIRSCDACGHFKSGSGPSFDCFSCAENCDCLVEGFTARDGKKYDGKYYPGVVRRRR